MDKIAGMKKSEYAVYDMKNKECLCGIFNSSECAKFLGISEEHVHTAVYRKNLVQKRYSIICIRSGRRKRN